MSTRIMHLAATLLAVSHTAAATANPKRGLVYVPSPDPWVNTLWVQDNSPLTWYYNYLSQPSDPFSGVSQSDFEFVPMMWGAGDGKPPTFLTNVTNLIKGGRNITHVLGFNEPDVGWSGGGSNISPGDAATIWIEQFVPLQEMGVKLGLPVIKADWDPTNWTIPFLQNCSAQLSSDGKNVSCPFDFVPIHAFGTMDIITRRLQRFIEVFPDKPLWLTEYACNRSDLATTQAVFNETLTLFDNSSSVGRYTYFGSFRSDLSNVGPNVAMLDPVNRFTDIGAWYLDRNATGYLPVEDEYNSGNSSTSSGSTTCSVTNPCGKSNDSGLWRVPGFHWGAFLAACFLLSTF